MQYSDEELHIDINNISLIISEYEQFKLSLLLFTISSIMDEILTLFNDIQMIVEEMKRLLIIRWEKEQKPRQKFSNLLSTSGISESSLHIAILYIVIELVFNREESKISLMN